MISGIGFQEILLIGMLVLIVFGPRGLSGVMRDLGRFFGSLRKYRDDFTREMMALSEPKLDEEEIRKNERRRIRASCKKAMEELTDAARAEQNKAIFDKVVSQDAFKNANALFCYLPLPKEPDTRPLVEAALKQGKKVFAPFCRPEKTGIGVARITDYEKDTAPGEFGIPEPVAALRSNEADVAQIDLFIVPGIAFDHDLTRLGRGKGYFDRFLADIKGKKPVWAIAFDEQVYPYSIPKYDHDVPVDFVISPLENMEKGK